MEKFLFRHLKKHLVGSVVFLLFFSVLGFPGYVFTGPSEVYAAGIETAASNPGLAVVDAHNPQVQAVLAIQNRHTAALMASPGLVGIGTGLSDQGLPAIVVFARSFQEARDANIPAVVEGVPVIVKISGEIKALKGKPSGTTVDPTARFPRPVPIGVSTGHPAITAGTIGARVTDGSNVYALSNNHVYANENGAGIGDNVLQPGAYDGGQDPADAIGTLYDYGIIDFNGGNNEIDAAIALSTTGDVGNATPSGGYGTPKRTIFAPAAINLPVIKYGRTTGQTKGKVYAINATVNVTYDQGIARFVNQIIITPGGFSAGGDSGSLIVVQDTRNTRNDALKPVGLLFAGSNLYTIANPIDAVLERFNVTIDGQ